MKLPRDVSGAALVRMLVRRGYVQVRQQGSHARLTRRSGGMEHHVTVPLHNPIKTGTLNAILKDVAEQLGVSREELLKDF